MAHIKIDIIEDSDCLESRLVTALIFDNDYEVVLDTCMNAVEDEEIFEADMDNMRTAAAKFAEELKLEVIEGDSIDEYWEGAYEYGS